MTAGSFEAVVGDTVLTSLGSSIKKLFELWIEFPAGCKIAITLRVRPVFGLLVYAEM